MPNALFGAEAEAEISFGVCCRGAGVRPAGGPRSGCEARWRAPLRNTGSIFGEFILKEKKSAVYDESKIQTLSSLEHIRLRTGMYIGRLGDGSNPDDGIYVLLKEVIDNAVDEYIMGNGKNIEVEIKDGLVKVRDFGRGIPLGKLVDCVST